LGYKSFPARPSTCFWRTNAKPQRRFFATRCIYTQHEKFSVWPGRIRLKGKGNNLESNQLGLLVVPLVLRRIPESFGPRTALDIGGLLLITGAALGVVWGQCVGTGPGGAALKLS